MANHNRRLPTHAAARIYFVHLSVLSQAKAITFNNNFKVHAFVLLATVYLHCSVSTPGSNFIIDYALLINEHFFLLSTFYCVHDIYCV